jgi:hypothetical protein
MISTNTAKSRPAKRVACNGSGHLLSDARPHYVRIRASDRLRNELEAGANRLGVTMSDIVHVCVLKHIDELQGL